MKSGVILSKWSEWQASFVWQSFTLFDVVGMNRLANWQTWSLLLTQWLKLMWVSVVSFLCQSGVSFRRKYLCHSYCICMVKRVAFVRALVQTQILEKPLDKEDATRMLTSLSGKAAYHLILSFQDCLLMPLVVMWTIGISLWVIQGSRLQRSERSWMPCSSNTVMKFRSG
jgi:hypothetical protein